MHSKCACTPSSNCGLSVFVWTGENVLKTLLVDAKCFENGEKKLRFQTKNVWMGPH